ncbi:sugar ABC transporter substrate-binding protein [Mesorhizobium sp. DCY119]|uniref:ABC transporter substrate-binding protein n=1 Tax=Mesorhizobium sp. DCY119 TaxID=2108445 RepID=UPI001FE207C5|nr:sugar ABC transporter substrate-binding protein [Mesorhizobium sp. DCY119]
MEILKNEFLKQTGVTLNITAVPYDQLQQQATLDVQSGNNQYDVIDYWYTSVGALATEGTILDITDRIDAHKGDINPDDFIPGVRDTYTLVNGRYYGLPYDRDTHVLFYNKEIFDRHGLKAPSTWDEYFEAAKVITEAEKANGIYGAIIMGFKAPIILGGAYVNRLAGFGGSLIVDGKANLASEEAIAAAVELNRAAPHCLPTPSEVAFEQGLPAFLSGKGAMIEFWTDMGIYAQDPKGSKIIDKWEVVQLPRGGKAKKSLAALNAGFAWAIPAGSKNPDLAFDFIRWAVTPQICEKLLLTTGTGIDPIRKSNLESAAFGNFAPKVKRAIEESIGNDLAWPTIPQSPELMQSLCDELSVMLAGQKTPEQAMGDAQTTWERIIG